MLFISKYSIYDSWFLNEEGTVLAYTFTLVSDSGAIQAHYRVGYHSTVRKLLNRVNIVCYGDSKRCTVFFVDLQVMVKVN